MQVRVCSISEVKRVGVVKCWQFNNYLYTSNDRRCVPCFQTPLCLTWALSALSWFSFLCCTNKFYGLSHLQFRNQQNIIIQGGKRTLCSFNVNKAVLNYSPFWLPSKRCVVYAVLRIVGNTLWNFICGELLWHSQIYHWTFLNWFLKTERGLQKQVFFVAFFLE